MRLFRRHRPEPAANPAAAPSVWPPQPEVVNAEPATEDAARPEPDAPARAVQVVTGPPPLRTPVPAAAPPPQPPATTAPEPEPAMAPTPEPAAAAAARVPESPGPMRHWYPATADMRVPAASVTPRRAAPRESSTGRWHQV